MEELSLLFLSGNPSSDGKFSLFLFPLSRRRESPWYGEDKDIPDPSPALFLCGTANYSPHTGQDLGN